MKEGMPKLAGRLQPAALLLLLLCAGAARGSDPTPAFPGAQGFGAFAVGGRGGDVYHVTQLGDAGAGSLRHGIESAPGARTIVFEVGGTIDLSSPLLIQTSNLSVAGQTAPGGIGTRGYPVVVSGASDVVIRYMRFRTGDINAQGSGGRPSRGNGDLPGDAADALSVADSERVMIDHVSTSWSMDETLSVTRSADVSVQHSIVSESLHDSYHSEGPHGFGSLLRGKGSGGYTFFGNLYAHHYLRSPAVGGEQDPPPGQPRGGLDIDFTNNVVYDWGLAASHTVEGLGELRLSYVSNVLVAGPSSICVTCAFVVVDPLPDDELSIFRSGNSIDSDRDGIFDPEPLPAGAFVGSFTLVAEPFDFERPPLEVLSASAAFWRVVRGAGASLARDAVDGRVIEQLREQTGGLIDSQDEVGGWPSDPPPQAPPPDEDRDGMADAWESRHDLDPGDASDRNGFELSPSYTNLEVYLQQLAGDPTPRGPLPVPATAPWSRALLGALLLAWIIHEALCARGRGFHQ
jgi:hypothetical protein